MSGFRRWYFYVVAGISLQAVTWAVIALLRNLLAPLLGIDHPDLLLDTQTVALQIAVVIIGLPMFLVHWRWAGRDGAAVDGTAETPERTLYLAIMLSAFLIPLVSNSAGFVQSLLRLVTGTSAAGLAPLANSRVFGEPLPETAHLLYTGAAMAVLAYMALLYGRLARRSPETPFNAAVSRLFIYFFSAAGLAMTSFSAAGILQTIFLAAEAPAGLAFSRRLMNETAVLLIGFVLWLAFWLAAQARYRMGGRAEQGAVVRKLYLYVVIFVAVFNSVAAGTALLSALFRRLLDVQVARGGSGVVFSTLIVAGLVWIYHALVLNEDAAEMPIAAEQAGLRRLYWYLVAGVALLAALIGLSGLLGILFDTGTAVGGDQREQLAWYAAMLFAGLLVWIVPWRLISRETTAPDPAGTAARTSLARRFYLFFFLLLASLTFLVCTIFILSRLLTLLFGETLQGTDGADMALAAAYALMAVAVWLYHGWLLRQDNEALARRQDKRAAATQVVVVDDGDGRLGRRLLEELSETLPSLQLTSAGLTVAAAAAMEMDDWEEDLEGAVATADIIVGPWSMAAPYAGRSEDERLMAAIGASPARKVIVPRPAPGWQWAGGAAWDEETAVHEAAETVAELIAGETAVPRRFSPAVTVAFLVAATIAALILVTTLLDRVLPLF